MRTYPTPELISHAASSLIISASGWRKVFAFDGDAESAAPLLSEDDQALVLVIAESFHQYVSESDGAIIIGTDSRPTGPAIADIAVRLLLARGHAVVTTGVCAIPELIAYTASRSDTAGFFYVSASHNPLGYNGIKFGGPDGSVLAADESRRIAERFEALKADEHALRDAHSAILRCEEAALEEVRSATRETKADAAQAYRMTTELIAGAAVMDGFRRALADEPLGIVIDFNGSARSDSIDVGFLTDLGVTVRSLNDTAGAVAHQIVPEGVGLRPCARALEAAHRQDPHFTLGYVPDNDGDRGNLLYLPDDAPAGGAAPTTAIAPHAQAVFALACLAELHWIRVMDLVPTDPEGRFTAPVAVVANGPTSLRVDALAGSFGAEVHRAEVGEANVVGLARTLRKKGYTVRILGEGSNGGNITHPGVVRDPLQTLLALLKLLRYRDPRTGKALLRDELPSMSQIWAALPAYVTTSAYEERAVMQIGTSDHRLLKSEYETIFAEEWEKRRGELAERYGIAAWREVNYEGGTAREGVGPQFRSGQEKGGLKILFSDAGGEDVAFIWMRGSGTEPVYRVLADVRGDDTAFHDELLAWHTEMV
ncbi:MAG: hypothetical protein GVY29_00510, partial [Spirochaetes bacterium]|nr:hypothetical protein [Spirochaetota bacterium]